MGQMATLHIRDVPDDVVETLKARATRNGRSLNREVVATLTRAATAKSVDEILADIDRIRSRIKNPPTGEEITAWIREAREERTEQILKAALKPRDAD
jgi:plasmid stability protein